MELGSFRPLHTLILCACVLNPAFALSASDVAPALSAEDAIAIALKVQPGTIGEAELDEFEGKRAYDIEVINDAGDEIEFKIDAETGAILNQWTDDDPSNDPVSALDDADG